MDKILALYANHDLAVTVRTQLFADGFPTDRIDVVDFKMPGRAAADSSKSLQQNLLEHFRVFFSDEGDAALVDPVVASLKEGKSAVVVHPRGQVEIDRARAILEGHGPDTVFWRVTPAEAQGGLLGERAAGG